MKQIVFAATLAGALFIGQFASAQSRGDLQPRQKAHKERMQQMHKGNITRGEAVRLRMQQAKVQNYLDMAMVDGKVNRKERGLITKAQRQASFGLYKAIQDNGRRPQAKAMHGRYGKQGHAYHKGGKGHAYKYGQHKGNACCNGDRQNRGEAAWKYRDNATEATWKVN